MYVCMHLIPFRLNCDTAFMFVYVHMYVCMYVNSYVQSDSGLIGACKRRHTYIHTYIHTDQQSPDPPAEDIRPGDMLVQDEIQGWS